MESKVTGCPDCPFKNYDELRMEYECYHPKSCGEHNGWSSRINYTGLCDGYEKLITPEWCPLKKESITITLIKDEL
jgi:hypothetical protein